MVVTFEWHPEKARTNLLKHGISFRIARSALLDPCRTESIDAGRGDEDRLSTVGLSGIQELCVVYTMRGETFRIISAREATTNESIRYWRDRYLHHGHR